MRRIQTYSNKYNTEKYSYCFKRENKFNSTKKMKKKKIYETTHPYFKESWDSSLLAS